MSLTKQSRGHYCYWKKRQKISKQKASEVYRRHNKNLISRPKDYFPNSPTWFPLTPNKVVLVMKIFSHLIINMTHDKLYPLNANIKVMVVRKY